jgi:hypothetical protein
MALLLEKHLQLKSRTDRAETIGNDYIALASTFSSPVSENFCGELL